MFGQLRRFFDDKRGIAGVEYAFILVSILVVSAAAFNMLSRKVDAAAGAAPGTPGAGGNLNGAGATVGAINGIFNGSPAIAGGGGAVGGGGPAVGAAAADAGAGGDTSAAAKDKFTAKYGANFKSAGEVEAGWKVYKESNAPAQIAVIGKRDDTAAAKNWPGHDGADTQGWTPAVNDAWIQGGIDRGATFFLGNNPVGGSFNNQPGAAHPTTIFKREFDQLLAAGYVQRGYEMWPPARK